MGGTRCVRVCIYVCMWMCVCVDALMCICEYVDVRVCGCVCIYVCMWIGVCVCVAGGGGEASALHCTPDYTTPSCEVTPHRPYRPQLHGCRPAACHKTRRTVRARLYAQAIRFAAAPRAGVHAVSPRGLCHLHSAIRQVHMSRVYQHVQAGLPFAFGHPTHATIQPIQFCTNPDSKPTYYRVLSSLSNTCAHWSFGSMTVLD